jgi:hypothetical protein
MLILEVVLHALKITALVFVMMVLVDLIDVRTRGTLKKLIRGGIWRQYTIASALGSTPGCVGSFMNVTLYMHGFLTFGAIVAGMVATSGDEAFVMLAEFRWRRLLSLVSSLPSPFPSAGWPTGWPGDLCSYPARIATSIRSTPKNPTRVTT